MNRTQKVSTAALKKVLDYNPKTGALVWRKRVRSSIFSKSECDRWNERFAGKPAMTSRLRTGIRFGSVLGKSFTASRIVWQMHYGKPPVGDIVYVDGDKNNLAISNLVELTRSQRILLAYGPHSKHNALGLRGVRRAGKVYVAKLGKRVLGRFSSMKAASQAYMDAIKQLLPERLSH